MGLFRNFKNSALPERIFFKNEEKFLGAINSIMINLIPDSPALCILQQGNNILCMQLKWKIFEAEKNILQV